MRQNLLKELDRLLLSDDDDYVLAKKKSFEIDKLLGFRCGEVEKKIDHKKYSTDYEIWSNLNEQAFQTPYLELKKILEFLNYPAAGSIVDIGSAYGRLGIIISFYFPLLKFSGFEVCRERNEEGQRVYQLLGIDPHQLVCQNTVDDRFVIPESDCYFIFDFGRKQHIEKVLNDLKIISLRRKISVVARGRGIRHTVLTEQPWLSQVTEPHHEKNWSAFFSA